MPETTSKKLLYADDLALEILLKYISTKEQISCNDILHLRCIETGAYFLFKTRLKLSDFTYVIDS